MPRAAAAHRSPPRRSLDAYLRAKAEAENTRRRAEDEISKARKFAIDAFAESLLPVKDSLEAAIAMEDRNQILCAQDGDFAEGVRAFLEKRRPVYATRES